VPILPQLAAVLTPKRPLRPDGLKVCDLPKRLENTGETLRRLYARAGLPAARGWHLLRHSFGTLLMRAGVPTPIIGRLISHRPGSVVTALYQHPDDADLVTAMQALGAYMERARAGER
jgi:integrase